MDKREKIIENFVSQHQPCSMEEMVEGLKEDISRNPLYEVVKILLAKGVLIDERKNRRDHRIFVNKGNLLVTVPPKIELFGIQFIDLVKSSQKGILDLRQKYKSPEQIIDLHSFEFYIVTLIPYEILMYVIDTYTVTSTLLWPKKVLKPEIMRELNSIVFSNISDIQSQFSDLMTHGTSILDLLANEARVVGGPLGLIRSCLNTYKVINLNDKFEALADTLWEISSDLRQSLSEREPKYYLVLSSDNWRQAIIDMQQPTARIITMKPISKMIPRDSITWKKLLSGEDVIVRRGIPSFLKS